MRLLLIRALLLASPAATSAWAPRPALRAAAARPAASSGILMCQSGELGRGSSGGSGSGSGSRSSSADGVQLSAAAADNIDGVLAQYQSENEALRTRVAELEQLAANTEGLCEVLDDGGGWTSSLGMRASWLLGLLVCQSASSFVLADNEALLVNHPTVIFFMTMLVGAGGNAGNRTSAGLDHTRPTSGSHVRLASRLWPWSPMHPGC